MSSDRYMIYEMVNMLNGTVESGPDFIPTDQSQSMQNPTTRPAYTLTGLTSISSPVVDAASCNYVDSRTLIQSMALVAPRTAISMVQTTHAEFIELYNNKECVCVRPYAR